MLFGAAYYPEHWPESRWERDAEMMERAGFNVVRMAEFAWHRMEPREGEFDFSWLDRAIGTLARHGIRVMLGTPTSASPKWLVDKYPDTLMWDLKGHPRGFGSRRYYCYNSDAYRIRTEAIVTAMAEHYAGNPNVLGWQIDNELGCGDTARCFCPACRLKFIDWLKARYGSVDEVNRQWGTVFSSQSYNCWEEVSLPTYTALGHHNPSLVLDFYRFSSDSVVSYQQFQYDILKKHFPDIPVTTNFMGDFGLIDYYNLARGLDLVALDIYPVMTRGNNPAPQNAAMYHDITRGLKRMNYWITEHQSGTPGAFTLQKTPWPGDLRRWTWQSVAHGADAILYFRWRTITFSVEEYWHGILNHDGGENRRYAEVKAVGDEFKRLSAVLEGSQIKADVAILKSYDAEWTFDIQPHVRGYNYLGHMDAYYRYFHERHIPVDIASPDQDLSGYRLVIAPNLIMTDGVQSERLHDYVRGGGMLIMDYRAGVKHMNNRMVEEVPPCAYADLLGVRVTDYGVIDRGEDIPVKLKDGQTGRALWWYDVLELSTAAPLAEYAGSYFTGSPMATENRYGSGTAWYLASEPEPALMDNLLDGACSIAGVSPLLDCPAAVEVARRGKDGVELLFVINHSREAQPIRLAGAYRDLLRGKELNGTAEIAANDVMVLTAME